MSSASKCWLAGCHTQVARIEPSAGSKQPHKASGAKPAVRILQAGLLTSGPAPSSGAEALLALDSWRPAPPTETPPVFYVMNPAFCNGSTDPLKFVLDRHVAWQSESLFKDSLSGHSFLPSS